MDITLKSPSEIEKMRIAGAATARVLEMIEPYVVPGVTTEELDNIMNDYIVNVENAKSADLGYQDIQRLPVSVSMRLYATVFLVLTS